MVRCGQGLQHWIFVDNVPFSSERVLVFKFWSCPGPLVLLSGEGHETLVPGATGVQNSLICAGFGCMTCSFVLLSLKKLSILLGIE